MKSILLLGSNSGDKILYIKRAIDMLSLNGISIISVSSIYQTAPWGFECDEPFINVALLIKTDLSAEELLKTVLECENLLGRKREGKGYSSRTIDIDIILCEELIVNSNDLTIPHPRMSMRRFVLEPIAEIAPNAIDPISKKTIAELLIECKDQLQVKKLTKNFA